MPFEERTVEMEREEFVKEWLSKKPKSFAAHCRANGISRPTGYLWLSRYEKGMGLKNASHAPFKTPKKTPEDMEKKIIELRKKEPGLGATKIKRMLEDAGETKVPCMSTINSILQKHNLITKKASEKATPYVRFEKEKPNEMWQCDFKGNYAANDGSRIYPLSVIDDCSRFCLNADAKLNEQYTGVYESLINTFRVYGMPKVFLCDNGNPWGNSQTTGYNRFEIWLMEHGVLVIHIRAKHPQSQGKVEKFNGSFKQERLNFHIPENFEDAAKQRLEYKDFYNNTRPHHALNLDVPAIHYTSSNIQYQEEVHEWEYDSDHELRKIKSSGYLTFKGQGYYLSEAFGGKTIALKPSSKYDGVFNLYYREFKIGRLSLKEKSIISRRVYLRENDPRL